MTLLWWLMATQWQTRADLRSGQHLSALTKRLHTVHLWCWSTALQWSLLIWHFTFDYL